jgi:hypothetical protein
VRAVGAICLIGVTALLPTHARADGRLLDDDSFVVHSSGPLLLDGGLVIAMPAALPAGMSTGIGFGAAHDCTCWFSYGVRTSWTAVTESSEAWTVDDWDFRLRATAGVRHRFGRGAIGVRLGLGTTIVREDRTRNEGMRAGLTGSELESVAVQALPAGEVEGVIELHVFGPWLLIASGGPSADAFDGALHGGWVAQLGVGWKP